MYMGKINKLPLEPTKHMMQSLYPWNIRSTYKLKYDTCYILIGLKFKMQRATIPSACLGNFTVYPYKYTITRTIYLKFHFYPFCHLVFFKSFTLTFKKIGSIISIYGNLFFFQINTFSCLLFSGSFILTFPK